MYLATLDKQTANPNQFVTFWRKFYNAFDDAKYQHVMDKEVLTTDDIYLLFLWKNNMKDGLSKTKVTFVTAIQQEIDTVNELKRNFSWPLFENTFSKRGPVWMITLLHTINRNEFPIYDQHAYRAYVFIETGVVVGKEHIPKRNQVFHVYKEYQVFFKRFAAEANNHEPKQVDEALWAFGKFLSYYGKMMMNE